VRGGVNAEHGGAWRPAARAFGLGREVSHVFALTLPLRAWSGNPSALGLVRSFFGRADEVIERGAATTHGGLLQCMSPRVLSTTQDQRTPA
jgi:hypothetical protein